MRAGQKITCQRHGDATKLAIAEIFPHAEKGQPYLMEFVGNLSFDPAFLQAVLPDGKVIRFTKTESRLLTYMAKNAGRVLSRNQLLVASGDDASDKNDRSIDFVINRLRTKMRDDPKDPTYIATRYGEGYVWIASSETTSLRASGAHAVVGPLLGLAHVGDMRRNAEDFGAAFHDLFRLNFSDGLDVVYDPDCPKHTAFPEDMRPEIGVEISFLEENGTLDCVLRGVSYNSGRTFYVARHALNLNGGKAENGQTAEELAGVAADDIRKNLALERDAEVPLAVGMIDAGTTFTGVKGHWSQNDESLRAIVQKSPDDHRATIMMATNIHTKYLQDSVSIFSSGADPRAKDEAEIEALVLQSLPYLNDDPSFLIVAAKLLFFVDKGYGDMAVELAEKAHRETTAPLASLPVIGQLRVFLGDVTSGLAAIDQALDQSEPGTQFEIYLLILKCEALSAIADRPAIDAVLAKVIERVPQIEVLMEVLFTDANAPSKAAQQALIKMPPKEARAMLMFMHYVFGRLLQRPEHRANAYRTPVSLFRKQFGDSVVPDEVWRCLSR